MKGELAVVDNKEMGVVRDTSVVLEEAKTAAKSLAAVIAGKKNPVRFNGEQYLEFEDWQTAGQFYGYAVRTGEAAPIEIDGVKGARAHAELIDREGRIVGGADSFCMRDEPNWLKKPWFQLASMAQTRAGAKALRNRLAWFVVLAGFRPTPAEEVERGVFVEATVVAQPKTGSTVSLVQDILNKLIEINNGNQENVEEHLRILTMWHDKKTGEEKWLRVNDLESVFAKKPDWIGELHKKVLAAYARKKI